MTRRSHKVPGSKMMQIPQSQTRSSISKLPAFFDIRLHGATSAILSASVGAVSGRMRAF